MFCESHMPQTMSQTTFSWFVAMPFPKLQVEKVRFKACQVTVHSIFLQLEKKLWVWSGKVKDLKNLPKNSDLCGSYLSIVANLFHLHQTPERARDWGTFQPRHISLLYLSELKFCIYICTLNLSTLLGEGTALSPGELSVGFSGDLLSPLPSNGEH